MSRGGVGREGVPPHFYPLVFLLEIDEHRPVGVLLISPLVTESAPHAPATGFAPADFLAGAQRGLAPVLPKGRP